MPFNITDFFSLSLRLVAKKEGLGFTFKSLCLKMKARVSGGGICVRLRNKLSLLAGSSILIIAPCLAKSAVAANDDHALTNVPGVTAGMEDGYQSADSSSSAGTSYAGIGYGDQLLTDPITLYKVPNFDFGYHKKTEGLNNFPLIESKGNRVLEVNDENGQLNWNVSAQLGTPSEDFTSSVADIVEIRIGDGDNKPNILINNDSSLSSDNYGLSLGSSAFSKKNNATWLSRNPKPESSKGGAIVSVNFKNINSAKLDLPLNNQPSTSEKYVAPITWTLNVTN